MSGSFHKSKWSSIRDVEHGAPVRRQRRVERRGRLPRGPASARRTRRSTVQNVGRVEPMAREEQPAAVGEPGRTRVAAFGSPPVGHATRLAARRRRRPTGSTGPNVSNAAAPGSVYGALWKARRVPSGDHAGREPNRLTWTGLGRPRARRSRCHHARTSGTRGVSRPVTRPAARCAGRRRSAPGGRRRPAGHG